VLSKTKRGNRKQVHQEQAATCSDVVCQYYKPIYGFMMYLTNDAMLAEDLTQETFLFAWENFESYKGNSSVQTWLHKIAYNKFIDSLRRLKCNAAAISGICNEKSAAPKAEHPLRQLMADEELRRIYEAMRKLESDEYLIILLHYIQGLSFSQMAEVVEQATGTIKWKTNQTLKKLRTYLCDEGQV
jgi:RNA polymerase sigma-70 factor, ECF subfamily